MDHYGLICLYLIICAYFTALPAEMIHIDLKAEKLENKGDLEVKVE